MGNSSRLNSGEYDPRSAITGDGGLLADRRVQCARARGGASPHRGAEPKGIFFFRARLPPSSTFVKRETMAFWRLGAIARKPVYFSRAESR